MNPFSVPFPSAPEKDDTYSIWKFDGLYWLLDPAKSGSGTVAWASLVEKPESIDSLGIDNEVSSGPYQSDAMTAEKDAPKFWSKKS